MLRFRRYRVFLVFAAAITILLVRLTNTTNWDRSSQVEHFNYASASSQNTHAAATEHSTSGPGALDQKLEHQQTPSVSHGRPPASTKPDVEQPLRLAVPSHKPTAAIADHVPKVILPDRKLTPPGILTEDNQESKIIHPVSPPGRQEFPAFDPAPQPIHWKKQVEHFPVPTESIIPLPTGPLAKIPRIQHVFNDETPDAKINREKRQTRVRDEFKKAWRGYRKHAWMHDELSPLSAGFRDPFCGWAATLVDSLDTLWIMGLHEEFEEAVGALPLIDFTTSPRADIPMFETTIRYMGGLLAAYDVSGAKYPSILAKAVELGEILIGAFDTPNRMPVLFYQWRPAFASQAHRASPRSNLAELGSLSLEFTRLAQLTNEPRYYDAVARITNALSEWQERGTRLGGVFPDDVDASGCNRSAPIVSQQPIGGNQGTTIVSSTLTEEPLGYIPNLAKTVTEPKPISQTSPENVKLQILPGDSSKAEIIESDGRDVRPVKRDLNLTATSNEPTSAPPTHPFTGRVLNSESPSKRGSPTGNDWECVAQGLESANSHGGEKYSMGGGQDSTYEYFPKQYLLLGGREEKYRTMYIKTIDAVRKFMLYRPMLPNGRNVLFAGKVSTPYDPQAEIELKATAEHLTCFIGGMVGMGAKIFGIESDLEIAKKLTDGCVWAYEATPSGIMPESAALLPCKSAETCPWNETAYWAFLDPMGPQRDKSVQDYLVNKAALDAKLEAERIAAVLKAEEAERTAAALKAEEAQRGEEEDEEDEEEKKVANLSTAATVVVPAGDLGEILHDTRVKPLPRGYDGEASESSPAKSLKRRQVSTSESVSKVASDIRNTQSSGSQTAAEGKYAQNIKKAEAEVRGMAADQSQKGAPQQVLADPHRPLTHKEHVTARIKNEKLPTGYVDIDRPKYILRPEAIESVWYMYRITGDAHWQEKGWKMFEAIVNATSTSLGNSAIYDVRAKGQIGQMSDEMESFWLAETLKYFYLLYSTPDTISLDEWVLNTEAHPFKRPTS